MENKELIGQIRQRLEILYQMFEQLEQGGSSPTDAYTKAQTDALLNGKVDKVAGSSLMTTAQANKLAGIESGAEVNVQANWNETDTTSDSYILNKPTIPDLTNYYTKTETEAEIQGAITDLDVPSTSVSGHYIKSIAQVDGLIEAVAELADTTPGNGSTRLITSGAVYTGLSGKASAANQAIDRAALVELVDGGAKNLSQWNSGTATGSGQTIGSQIPFTTSGNLVVSFQSDASTGYLTLGFKDASNETLLVQQINNSGTKIQEITIPSGVAYFNIVSSLNATYSNFMICSKADWDVSHAFQPYRPTYQELYEMVQALQPAQT